MSPAPTKTAPAAFTTRLTVARVPFLNCAPFFQGLAAPAGPSTGGVELVELSPRQSSAEAEAGRIAAAPMPLADFLRMQDRFERLGTLGIAVRGRCGSTQLFSRRPIRQLDGATIAVSEDTSTTAVLLRLILEQRYAVSPAAYRRAPAGDVSGAGGKPEDAADAVLLIGDEALRVHATTRAFPFETDLSFEWWLWQHLPSVFAVWAVRKDCPAEDKQRLLRLLQHQVAVNSPRLGELARARAEALGVPADELTAYLSRFVYRFSEPEEQAIARFAQLAHAHGLL